MEQNNLIVTADSKSWDEVTRDTSYIGNIRLRAKGHDNNTANSVTINDEWRGTTAINGCTLARFNKDFAIAYDRMICLKDGFYNIIGWTYTDTNISGGSDIVIKINGVNQASTYVADFDSSRPSFELTPFLKRGDYVQWYLIHYLFLM